MASHSIADDHNTAADETDQRFQMAITACLMDTAAFHDIDERLNEAGQIDAGDTGVVNRVNRLLAATDWPAELQPQAETLQTVLADFAEALANDDVEAAQPLAAQAHQAQHDLSHAVASWLSELSLRATRRRVLSSMARTSCAIPMAM